jgi:DNA-binding MarR family transcriptional regulator
MSNNRRNELRREAFAANRAYQRAADDLDEAVIHHLGINRSDGRCLDVLEERGPIAAGELAAATGLSPGAITTLVDRLEEDGFVRRVRDAADRRRVLIELTESARAVIDDVYGPLVEGDPWIRELDAEQLTLIRDFLRLGAERNVKTAARVRALPAREGRRTARTKAS